MLVLNTHEESWLAILIDLPLSSQTSLSKTLLPTSLVNSLVFQEIKIKRCQLQYTVLYTSTS